MSSETVIPPYELYPVRAVAVKKPTPRLKRLTVQAEQVPGLRADLPGQWLKVYIRGADGLRQPGRAYTVRRYQESTGLLELDFVLHGSDGRMSAWATDAKVGDTFEISAPHPRGGICIDPATRHYILLGDETGLPAIAAILEALPATAQVTAVVEIQHAAEQQRIATEAQLSLRWLRRDARAPLALAQALETIELQPECVCFIAAESSVVAAARSRLKAAATVDSVRIHASGYWKRGQSDHKDAGPD